MTETAEWECPYEWHARAYKGIMVNKTCHPAAALSSLLTWQTKTNDKFVVGQPTMRAKIFRGLETARGATLLALLVVGEGADWELSQ